ncbi:peptidase family M48 [Zalerion maritima]|uniref:CAAX prenyl protease n=1 Tax=Zalerion maritima TaxID=339359 RepID=A0AAD5RSL5_9PEZI|nr:peptidase family M48 [Zalerion maritima]
MILPILQRLARFLDRPLFPWKNLILGFSFGQFALESLLSLRQYRVLQRASVPKVLAEEVTPEVHAKSQAYGRANAEFSFLKGIYSQITNFAFIQLDILPKLWDLTGSFLLKWSPARFSGEISHSIVFLLSFMLIHTLLDMPASLYHTFVLEEKFGFNKQTPSLYISDFFKSQLLSFALVPPILAGFLKIIQSTGNQFFFYLWAFTASIQVFMISFYPVLILPLFNKLSPLEDGDLKQSTEALARKLEFPLSELNVIDGSKRSSHSNAYFFGLPWKKHIVIFDTLIEKSTPQEVVSVLAHELGHWSLGHTTKLFAITQFHLLYIFALFSVFINNSSLYADFGFVASQPIIIGFLLFSDAFTPMDTIVKLLMNVLSRKFEYQADAFAKNLGYSADLARSLIKLQIQNLSTMEADWMYSTYHYSHPILSERLRAIGWVPEGKVTEDEKPEAKTTGAEL